MEKNNYKETDNYTKMKLLLEKLREGRAYNMCDFIVYVYCTDYDRLLRDYNAGEMIDAICDYAADDYWSDQALDEWMAESYAHIESFEDTVKECGGLIDGNYYRTVAAARQRETYQEIMDEYYMLDDAIEYVNREMAE